MLNGEDSAWTIDTDSGITKTVTFDRTVANGLSVELSFDTLDTDEQNYLLGELPIMHSNHYNYFDLCTQITVTAADNNIPQWPIEVGIMQDTYPYMYLTNIENIVVEVNQQKSCKTLNLTTVDEDAALLQNNPVGGASIMINIAPFEVDTSAINFTATTIEFSEIKLISK